MSLAVLAFTYVDLAIFSKSIEDVGGAWVVAGALIPRLEGNPHLGIHRSD